MIKGEYKKLEEIAQFNVCAEHKKILVIAWNGEEDAYALRCGEGHFPDAVTRAMDFEREVIVGQHEDVDKAVKTRRKHEAKEKTVKNKTAAVSFPGVPAIDLGTGALLPVSQVQLLVKYARRYGLDPVRSHVVMYYGKPYITADGYLFHANKTKQSYKLRSRPLKAEERLDYQVPDRDHAWIAEVIKYPGQDSFTGLGIVTQEEIEAKSKADPSKPASPVVAKHPQLLAQKRAEWQALKKAFPIGEEPDNE